MYKNDQPGYVPKEHDWRCLLCHNINFEWRKSCNNQNCGAPRDYTKKRPGDKNNEEELEKKPESKEEGVTKEELNPLEVPTEEEVEEDRGTSTASPEQLSMESILKLRDWHLSSANPQGCSNSIVCLCGEIVNLDDYLLHGKCLGWTKDVMRIQTRTSYKFSVRMRFWRIKKEW